MEHTARKWYLCLGSILFEGHKCVLKIWCTNRNLGKFCHQMVRPSHYSNVASNFMTTSLAFDALKTFCHSIKAVLLQILGEKKERCLLFNIHFYLITQRQLCQFIDVSLCWKLFVDVIIRIR